MLRVAAEGHRQLCVGQGAELCWTRNPGPLRSLEVLDIFRQKTAPAFEVALRLGAIYAAAGDDVSEVLNRYSENLGIAYQIRDDLDDCHGGEKNVLGPSILLSIAYERAAPDTKKTLESIWTNSTQLEASSRQLQDIFIELKVQDRGRQLLESYKEEAIRSLRLLDNANLKGLLRRVIGKIFNDVEIKGWCSEFEARNAAGRASGAETAV
jgi:geranylgeranyl pyrophosphate synthase